MNKKNKEILLGILMVGILVAALVLLNKNQASKKQQAANQAVLNQAPKSFMAVMKTLEPDRMTVSVGTAEKIVLLDDNTSLSKQAKDKQGLIVIVPATRSDLKVGTQIVVAYFQQPQADTYKAVKIQIIQ